MSQAPYLLYAANGTGSAIVECMLALCGVSYQLRIIDYEKDVIGENPELKALNPLSRVPTLKLPNGEALTESGAIGLHLGGLEKGDLLIPPHSAPESTPFYRFLFLINSEIYPTFTFADIPSEWVSNESSQEELANSIRAFRKELWRLLDGALSASGPWALGSRFSAIDCYLAVMTHWGPGREWFRKNTPRISAISDLAWDRPDIGPVLRRNFPNG